MPGLVYIIGNLSLRTEHWQYVSNHWIYFSHSINNITRIEKEQERTAIRGTVFPFQENFSWLTQDDCVTHGTVAWTRVPTFPIRSTFQVSTCHLKPPFKYLYKTKAGACLAYTLTNSVASFTLNVFWITCVYRCVTELRSPLSYISCIVLSTCRLKSQKTRLGDFKTKATASDIFVFCLPYVFDNWVCAFFLVYISAFCVPAESSAQFANALCMLSLTADERLIFGS